MTTPGRATAWSSADVLRVTALVVGFCLLLILFWVAQDIFFLAFVGLLFGLTLSAAADWAQRRLRLPRAVAAPLILLSFLGLIVSLGIYAAPQVTQQLREVQDKVPQVVGQVRGWIAKKVGGVTQMFADSTSKAKPDSTGAAPQDSTKADTAHAAQPKAAPPAAQSRPLSPQFGAVGRAFFTVFSSTLSALAGLILVIFLTIFIAIDPGLYQRGVIHLLPHSARPRMEQVMGQVATILRRWLVTQLIAMVVIGLVTGLTLWALGIQGAVALGVIAGLLEFIPFLGPIAAAVPAIAMGFLDSPEKALWVTIAFTVIQQAEGHLLIPLLMKDSLDLPPVLTILSQALMATVFGFLGLVVAVPALAAGMVALKMLYVYDVVGDNVKVGGVHQ